MGCSTSKHTIGFRDLDDSIHVASSCFVPRVPHPLLIAKQYEQSDVDDSTMNSSMCESEEEAACNTD
jgi:hypothetical protein